MSLAEFQHVLNNAPWTHWLNLWHRGEPLAASEFPEMVGEAAHRRIMTNTHSNGLLLSHRERAERLVRAGLSSITIGLDGATEETYRSIRLGGSLAEVKAGVKALLEARCRLSRRRPLVMGECLLSRQPLDELRGVRELAREWGLDGLRFKTLRVTHPDRLDELAV